jgi:hypothetical protein
MIVSSVEPCLEDSPPSSHMLGHPHTWTPNHLCNQLFKRDLRNPMIFHDLWNKIYISLCRMHTNIVALEASSSLCNDLWNKIYISLCRMHTNLVALEASSSLCNDLWNKIYISLCRMHTNIVALEASSSLCNGYGPYSKFNEWKVIIGNIPWSSPTKGGEGVRE